MISAEQPPAPKLYDQQWLEQQLREIRQEVYLIRTFLEPLVVNTNAVAPETVLDTLE